MRQHAKDMDASYGPTHVYYTPWDADMIYGCECDSGFTGFDCSQRVCPRGDDPLTTGQVEEVQIFECQKNGLTDTSEVVFYIMGYPTIALPASTTAFDLRVALEVRPPPVTRTAGVPCARPSRGAAACDMRRQPLQWDLSQSS